jgi:spermidine/putrescine ABC transporter ATP-binding subunit
MESALSQSAAAMRESPAPTPATLLSICSVTKSFGHAAVLRGISLDVAEGEFLTILGESGSGKTTLLRLIAGFEQVDSGQIWMCGERLDAMPPYKRRVNTVFQQYALFPHLSVFDNVAYGLRVAKVEKKEIESRVDQALRMVKMSAFARSAPANISGGQQQRVALARALVNRPRLLLLDEPLSALDANLRRQMQVELKSLQREVGISFVFVTHDQQEAMAMSDRIALLRGGELEQVATPREIYFRPATAYVAQFVGQTNLLRCEVVKGITRCGSLTWVCNAPDGPLALSLRPEDIKPADAVAAGTVRFRAKVRNQLFQGATDLLEVECSGGPTLLVRLPAKGLLQGEVQFAFSPADAVPVRGGDR